MLTQHVVFRLSDSIQSAAPDRSDESVEAILDRGLGDCLLAERWAAQVVSDALLHFDGERYRLRAWCVMPNHVHVVLDPLTSFTLGGIVKSWKAFTSRQINARLIRSGRIWAPDYFDRYMRNDTQLAATLRYVERNPVSAGLCERVEDWAWSSAHGEILRT